MNRITSVQDDMTGWCCIFLFYCSVRFRCRFFFLSTFFFQILSSLCGCVYNDGSTMTAVSCSSSRLVYCFVVVVAVVVVVVVVLL